jgi:hypothetical protein
MSGKPGATTNSFTRRAGASAPVAPARRCSAPGCALRRSDAERTAAGARQRPVTLAHEGHHQAGPPGALRGGLPPSGSVSVEVLDTCGCKCV